MTGYDVSNRMISKGLLVFAGLFLLTILIRLPFADPLLYSLDSGHFALALGRFDVSVQQPHPPGYFLYVMLGRLAMAFTGDANKALVAISILFSGLTVALMYLFGKLVYGHREGLAAALIAMTSPLAWFQGIVGLTYIVEGFLSLLAAYLCYRIIKGEGRLLLLSAVVLGLAGGVRQNTLVFLLPLWVYSIREQGVRRCLPAFAVLALIVLAWSLPMVMMTGGYAKYEQALSVQVSAAVWYGVGLYNTLRNAKNNLYFLTWGLFAALIPLCMHALSALRARKAAILGRPSNTVFYVMWILPSLAFYLIVFTQGNAPGYSLFYLVCLYLIAGRALSSEADRLKIKSAWAMLLAVVISVNSLAFIFMDFPFSYRGLKEHNRTLSVFIKGLKDNFPPDRTAVMGSEHMFISYRHVCYYLPEYTAYYIAENTAPSDRYYLRCHNRNTERLTRLEIPADTQYLVHFVRLTRPLPENARAHGARALHLEGADYLIYYDYRDLAAKGASLDSILLSY